MTAEIREARDGEQNKHVQAVLADPGQLLLLQL